MKKGSWVVSLTLFVVSLLIIVISIINSNNFSIALAPFRIKNISVQRLYGEELFLLRASLMAESLIISFFSFLLSLFFVFLLNRIPEFTQLLLSDIGLSLIPLPVMMICVLMAFLVGVISGLWPTLRLTIFSLSETLKGRFRFSRYERHFQNGLIFSQFVISFVLILVALFMNIQNTYMRNRPTGFETANVLTVKCPDGNPSFSRIDRNALVNRIKAYNDVEGIAFSQSLLFNSADRYSRTSGYLNNGGELLGYVTMSVSDNFFSFMEIPVFEGDNLLRMKTIGTVSFSTGRRR